MEGVDKNDQYTNMNLKFDKAAIYKHFVLKEILLFLFLINTFLFILSGSLSQKYF